MRTPVLGLWEMNNGSASMSGTPIVVTLWHHTVHRSIHQNLLVGTGEEEEVDEVAGWVLCMLSVSGKWLMVVLCRWTDFGYSKVYRQRGCRAADLSYKPGSPYCMPTGCTVVTGFERIAEGCRLTGAEVNSGVGVGVDSLARLDHR